MAKNDHAVMDYQKQRAIYREFNNSGFEAHWSARTKQLPPARKIVTAKLMGDPPANLAERRANPGYHGK